MPVITDVCLVTRDLDAAVAFYSQRLGFELASRMPGFADFSSEGVTLALWDAQAIREATGVPAQVIEPDGHGVMIARELALPSAVDDKYHELSSRGVEFYGPPRDYPWNARAIYLAGVCGEFWEFYAWNEGGKHGHLLARDPAVS